MRDNPAGSPGTGISDARSSLFLVTGASSGIGLAIVKRLIASGRQVIGMSRRTEVLARLEAELGSRFRGLACDLADDDSIAAFIEDLGDSRERLQGIVHCAGVVIRADLGEVASDDLDHMMSVNFRGPFVLTNRLVPALIANRGDLIFVNSSAALHAGRSRSAYSATKCALKALADHARVELNSRGVRVASVYPGRTATRGMEAIFDDEGRPYEPEALLQPDDVASAVIGILEAPDHAEITDVVLRPRTKTY